MIMLATRDLAGKFGTTISELGQHLRPEFNQN